MEQRRLLLFFLASLVILVSWQLLVPSPAPPPRAPETTGVPTPSAPGTASPALLAAVPGEPVASGGAAEAAGAEETVEAPPVSPPAPPIAAAAEERVELRGEGFVARFTNRGAQLVSFELPAHKDAKGRPLELVRTRAQGPWPLALLGPDLAPLPLGEALFAVERGRDAEGREELRFAYRGPLGAARKVVRVLGPSLLGLEVESDATGWGLLLGPGLRNPTAEELVDGQSPRSAVYRLAGEVEVVPAAKRDELLALPGSGLSWVGVEDNYFLITVMPETPVEEAVIQPVVVTAPPEGGPYRLEPFRDEEALPEPARKEPRDLRVVLRPSGGRLAATAYLGAKEYERLATLGWGLEETLQWGWFGILARPLLWGLLWLHDHAVANYGWAIALLTLAIRILLFPLTWTSQKSMARMQELQPRMQAIRQKYRGKLRDKKGRMDLEAQRKMNEEIQELFRSEGANPYGGCLPILVQIPVFFALFAMLRSAVELRHAPWLLWIHDLSVRDPIYVLPVLMGATQIYQMRMTPMSGDPMQRRMMQLFPWIFTIFSLGFPAGLVLYWTVNNVITIGQTWVFLRLKKRKEREGKPRRGHVEERG